MVEIHFIETMDMFLQNFRNSTKALLLLVAESCDFRHGRLSEIKSSVYGAVFPQIIYQHEQYSSGMVVIELQEDAEVFLCAFDQCDFPTPRSGKDNLMVFVDGLSAGITEFLERVYESTSMQTNIIGAGAGKTTFKQEPVLFSQEKIIQDGALVVSAQWDFSVQAMHGWEAVSKPLIASRVDKNILQMIDYAEAFGIYKSVVESDSNRLFDENDFFDLAKAYPLGISKIGGEIVVRDPVAKKGNSLVLVGEMEKNSIIYVLKGEDKKLIEAARNAAQAALSKKKGAEALFVIDCISRALFLEEAFEKELQAIHESVGGRDVKVFGVLSIGEIANSNREYIDFYNKTCVAGAF